VPVGLVRFVFRSTNKAGIDEFRVEELGQNKYARISVPPNIWFGFQGMHMQPSLVLNIANIPHNPDEVERLAITDIDFDW
jgi:dTDP-4-dehydrorhamnose 3,5-epimerase